MERKTCILIRIVVVVVAAKLSPAYVTHFVKSTNFDILSITSILLIPTNERPAPQKNRSQTTTSMAQDVVYAEDSREEDPVAKSTIMKTPYALHMHVPGP
jgi:hypothetical protein